METSRLYKEIDLIHDEWDPKDTYQIKISRDGNYHTIIGPFSIEDLKELKRVINKKLKVYDN